MMTTDQVPDRDAKTHAEWRLEPEDWDEAIARVGGPQIIVGGPGTGKTEFLVRRAVHLVTEHGVPGDEIVVLSFGRRGVADLDARLRGQLAEPTSPVNVVTFHSLAAGIVEAHATAGGWERPPQILTGPEQTALVREMLAGEELSDWPVVFAPMLGTSTLADEVTDFLLRASEQMLDPAGVAHRAEGRDDWRALPAFMARYRRELVARGRIDYSLLLQEAARAVEDGVADLGRFRFVLVDEYQDTTVSQARLLAAVVARHRNLTVAADPYQSIYSFRGAAVQNVARFPEEFRDGAGGPARRIVLTTSFRTPAEILAAAERVTAHDVPGAAGPVIPAAGSGRVDVHVFDQHSAEAEWIASEILRLHLAERVALAAMAVFVRSKRRFIAELSRALQRRGIAHDPPTSRLAEQPAVRFVLDMVTAATAGHGPEADRSLRRVLLGPWFEVPIGTMRDLERLRIGGALSWTDAIRQQLPAFGRLADLLDDAAWATQRPAIDGVFELWSSLPQLLVVATDPDRGDERAAWASLSQVLGRWNDRNPQATLGEYRRLLLDEEFEARPLLSYALPEDDRLTVTTLHQAKGLEFDVVFIADAVEGVFPDLRVRDSLLGVRHLLPDVPRSQAEYVRFRLQEERRLAYTAMTRAARRVVWTATSTGFEEGRGIPSRFLALVADTDTVAEAATPATHRTQPVSKGEAEALLRRLVADPAVARSRRYAALDLLAHGPEAGLRSPWTFSGLRDPGHDSGLVGERLVMSPSQADAYRECPRRYALMRRLGIGDTAGPHAALGGLVHSVMEAAALRAMDDGRPRSSLGDAIDALEDQFAPEDFGGEPYATAWRRRAELILSKLYELWPSRRRVVAVEKRLSADIGDVQWVGYADRLEESGGTITVVDYKTGGKAVSIADAAESLQLGFYLLASRSDPDVLALGEPVGAEFWFPYASRDQRSMSVRSFDPANLPHVAAALADAAIGIRAEDWTPIVSTACERCPVRRVCPAQPEGQEGFMP